MSKRAKIKTKKEEIVSYWAKHQSESGLSVDWSEADQRCWRCGNEKTLERCHIIPHSLGGKDAPENLVLLCKRCHAEGPNVVDSEIMWDWIKAYAVPFYTTFWGCKGLREYRFIYGHSFENALIYIAKHSKTKKDEMEIVEYVKEKVYNPSIKSGIHFGQNYKNTATLAGIYRMVIKSLANEMSVDIEKMDKEIVERATVWWG